MNALTSALRDAWWATRTNEQLHSLIGAEEQRAKRMAGSSAEMEALGCIDRARAELQSRTIDFSNVLRRMSMVPFGGEKQAKDQLVRDGADADDIAFALIGMEICAQPFNYQDYLNQPRGQVFGVGYGCGMARITKRYQWCVKGNMYSGSCG